MVFETLTVRKEGAVLFAQMAAPPINLLTPKLVGDLVCLIQEAEADDAVQVLVFTSADPDYFIAHVDVTRINEYRAQALKLTGEPSLALLLHHLSKSRLVTIAQIEGRVRGVGSEFVLALDMSFAARESAIFSQFEPAFGVLPGGGATQHLVRLMGRSRTLEVMLSAEDYDADPGRAVRLDQSSAPGPGARRVRRVARTPDRRVSRRWACRGQGPRQRDRARAGRGLPSRFRPLCPCGARARGARPARSRAPEHVRTRDAEMDLATMLGELARGDALNRPTNQT